MQILGLLGMFFDAVVVEIEKYLFFQIGSGHIVLHIPQNYCTLFCEFFNSMYKIS